jgi:VanZ family protein
LFKKYIKKYLWIAVIIYAALIFVGSSIPGTEIDTGPPGFDKVLHLFEYLILSFLIYFAIVSDNRIINYKIIFFISFLLSSLYGISDEIHQLFVPNRFFELLDIFTDSIGSLLGSFWAFKISTR